MALRISRKLDNCSCVRVRIVISCYRLLMIFFQPDIRRHGKQSKWPWQREETWIDSDISQYAPNLEINQPLSCLLLDNYDSYSYNLYQLIYTLNGKPPFVVHNDHFATCESLWSNIGFKPDCTIISPGPGRPDRDGDFHLCRDVLKYAVDIPTLGVCLGHQGLALAYGAEVVKRKSGPMHGRITKVYHDSSDLFAGLEQGFDVVRYHSFLVNDHSPAFQKEDCPIQVIARSEDNDIMGIKHTRYPHWGVQFHPESAGTIQGPKIFQNFLSATRHFHSTSAAIENKRTNTGVPVSHSSLRVNPISSSASALGRSKTLTPDECAAVPPQDFNNMLVAEAIPFDCDPESVFLELFANNRTAWWLDSRSAICPKTAKFEFGNNHTRFSYMGSPSGCPNSEIVEYHGSGNGGITLTKGDQVEYLTPELGIVQYLQEKLPCRKEFGQVRVELLPSTPVSYSGDVREKNEGLCGITEDLLPFNLLGGYVGFSGYEVGRDTIEIQSRIDGTRWHRNAGMTEQAHSDKDMSKEHGRGKDDGQAKGKNRDGTLPSVPESLWVRASRYIAFDHHTKTAYVVADASVEGKDKCKKWIRSTVQALRKLATYHEFNRNRIWGHETEYSGAAEDLGIELLESNHDGQLRANRPLYDEWFAEPAIPKPQYKAKINECMEYLKEGESYEICLTNQFNCPPLPSSDVRTGALELYKALRRKNPAPYAAFLSHGNYAVCCSSPELFLRLERDGTVLSKPIKGTAPRGDTAELDKRLVESLAEDDKTVAENLMILDLIRNDLGRVCKMGSVVTPDVMKVETYATVHHLVSTIRGQLGENISSCDLFAATFPGGSMIGAPKVRTVKILKKLENSPRGVYSGTIGYFSLDGPCVLNIVIRTAVVTDNGVSVGAGGAIVSMSNVDEECDETFLKAQSVLPCVEATYAKLKKRKLSSKKKHSIQEFTYNMGEPQLTNPAVIGKPNEVRAALELNTTVLG